MPNRNVEGNYRYAYQGQEKDPETGKEAFELRLWDSRIGRWLTADPYGQYNSPYLGMGNDPISGIDPDGGWKTKWGQFWAWVGNGFKGDRYTSDSATGNGKYGISFDDGDTGIYLATDKSGLDVWNGTQGWDNYQFSLDGVGREVNVFRPVETDWKDRWARSDNIIAGFSYGIANDAYQVAQIFDPFTNRGTNPISGARISRNIDGTPNYEQIDGVVGTLTFAIPFARGAKATTKLVPEGLGYVPKLNAAQFSSTFKGSFLTRLRPKIRGLVNKHAVNGGINYINNQGSRGLGIITAINFLKE